MKFTKATKKESKLRAAIFGPSGSGKTFSALNIATGIGQPIALIDTEHGSASKYSDRFEFDVLNLPTFSIDTYLDAINVASRAGYGTLIIDSLSHGWQELLREIDLLAASKYKGNSWSAWSEGTPRQKKMIAAILQYPGNIIATMRSKTEWTLEKGKSGKSSPVRVGMAPEQGKGIEYEFDFLIEISTEHVATVIKDRSGRFQDKMIEKPGKEFGSEIAKWLSYDAPAIAPEDEKKKSAFISEAQHQRLEAIITESKVPRERIRDWVENRHGAHYPDGVHFNKLYLGHAAEVEKFIPRFQKKIEKEWKLAQSERANKETLEDFKEKAAIDWVKENCEWSGNLDNLKEITIDLASRAQASKEAAQRKDGQIDEQEMREATKTEGIVAALESYITEKELGG